MGNLDWLHRAIERTLDGDPPGLLLPVDFPQRTPNHWSLATGAQVLQCARNRGLRGQAPAVCSRAAEDLVKQHVETGFMGREGVSNSYSGAVTTGLLCTALGAAELLSEGEGGEAAGRALDWSAAILRQELHLAREWRLPNGHCGDAGTRWKHPWWERNVSGLTLLACRVDGAESPESYLRDVLEAAREDLGGPLAQSSREGTRLLARLLWHEPGVGELLDVLSSAGRPSPPGRLHREFSWRKGDYLEEIRVGNLPAVKDEGGVCNLFFGAEYYIVQLRSYFDRIDWLRGERGLSGEVVPRVAHTAAGPTGMMGPEDPPLRPDLALRTRLLTALPSPLPKLQELTEAALEALPVELVSEAVDAALLLASTDPTDRLSRASARWRRRGGGKSEHWAATPVAARATLLLLRAALAYARRHPDEQECWRPALSALDDAWSTRRTDELGLDG